MQKPFIGLLALAVVALGVICAFQRNQLRSSRERVAQLEQSVRTEAEKAGEQSARVRELQQKATRLESQMEQFVTLTATLRASEARHASNAIAWAEHLQAAQARSPEAADGAAGEGGKSASFGKGMSEMLAGMLKDPDMREMMRGQQKAAINMMYSELFKGMNLSSEERDRLISLLTDAQMKQIENAPAILDQDKANADTDSTQRLRDAKDQTDADIKALLGEDRFAQYKDYQKNLGEHMQLNQLKTHLETQNLALQEQQSAQLLQVMLEEKAKAPPAIPTDNSQIPSKDLFTAEKMDQQMQWMENYNRRVMERAASFLAPEQLAQYRQFQEQQAAMQKFGLKMAREMFGGSKDAPDSDASAPK